MRLFIIAIMLTFATSTQALQQTISVDAINVIKISARDERAVIKTAAGRLQVIKVGDRIGEHAKVIEITRGRVVIEEMTVRGVETVIIRVENGKQSIEKIRRVEEKQPLLYVPSSSKQPHRGN